MAGSSSPCRLPDDSKIIARENEKSNPASADTALDRARICLRQLAQLVGTDPLPRRNRRDKTAFYEGRKPVDDRLVGDTDLTADFDRRELSVVVADQVHQKLLLLPLTQSRFALEFIFKSHFLSSE